MFWTDWGDRAAGVYRSYMDGSNVSCIVSEGVRWPNGITADDHWLYWTEAYSDRIERADFTGGQRSVLMEGLPHPYAIAVFKVRLNKKSMCNLKYTLVSIRKGLDWICKMHGMGESWLKVTFHKPVLDAVFRMICTGTTGPEWESSKLQKAAPRATSWLSAD